MNIYVSSAAIAVITILIINCIISFGKSKIFNLCHIILSSIFSIVGIAGAIVIRMYLIKRLNQNAEIRDFETDFVSWAIEKFDFFAIISITITCAVVLFFLFYLILNKNKTGFFWTNTTVIIIYIMIINFIAGIWYGLGTINKLFDLAGYISQLTVFEFFILHIPLVVKRILMNKYCYNLKK